MSYMKDLAYDARTCGEADDDAWLDGRDGYYYRPAPRTCDVCLQVPAVRRVTHRDERDGTYVTANVCTYCAGKVGK